MPKTMEKDTATFENITKSQSYEILSITPETDIEFVFKVAYPDTDKINFGQFLQISVPTFGECPISISDFSVEEKWIEFLIRKVGVVTDALFELKPGDKMQLRGSYGNGFDFSKFKDKNLIIVSGGSGLAPVRSLINYVYNNPKTVASLELLMGFKNADSLLFQDDIRKWREHFPTTICTDESCDLDGYCTGLVTKYVSSLSLIKEKLDNVEVVIVGPPMMMKFTTLEFIKLGIAEENIWVSFERKMSCGVGKCGHCRIDEVYICLDGPVFNYSFAKDLID